MLNFIPGNLFIVGWVGVPYKDLSLCEGGIEKSVPRITNWHHKTSRLMTNGDYEGGIFLSYPHTNNGLFFLHTIKYSIFVFKKAHRSS